MYFRAARTTIISLVVCSVALLLILNDHLTALTAAKRFFGSSSTNPISHKSDTPDRRKDNRIVPKLSLFAANVPRTVDASAILNDKINKVKTDYHYVTVNNVDQNEGSFWKGHQVIEAHGGTIKAMVKGTDITQATKKSGVLKTLPSAGNILFSNHVDPTHMERYTKIIKRRLPGKSNLPQKTIIGLYHIYHGGLKNHAIRSNKTMNACPFYKNCVIKFLSKISNEVVNADAVIFQGNNMPKIRPKRRDPNQVFIFHTVESPQYLHVTKLSNPWFDNYFNWTMTYRLDSDIPFLYGSVIPKTYVKTQFIQEAAMTGTYGDLDLYNEVSVYRLNDQGIPNKNYAEIFRKKDRTAAWLVSHCQTASKREWLVSQMQKYTRIDKIGGCSKNKSFCPKGQACDDFIVDSYKFYIAFENSLCTDYITEKVFNWYAKDIIVVVRGAREYRKYLPEGTYIDADNFRTPEELALYLNKLGANEEEYIRMLKRRDNFIELSFDEHSHVAYCHLCYRLNNLDQFRKSVPSIHTWWDQGGVCHRPTGNALLEPKPRT